MKPITDMHLRALVLQDLGVDDEHPIPLPTVSGAILEKVIDYCTHHKVWNPY